MSTEHPPDYQRRLEALEDRIRRDPSFSAEDITLIHDMIAIYRGIAAWGRMGRVIVISLAAVAGAMAAWDVIAERVKGWLTG